MENSYKIVKSLLRTEKGSQMLPLDKYLFMVAKNANKLSIKKAVEELYKVKVKNVNTIVSSGKKRRVRYQLGYKPDWKKAVVTLKAGDKIELT